MSRTRGFFAVHKRTILALIFGLAFSATLAYAVPPGSQYNAGETLDPGCAPGDTNCSVIITNLWGGITGTLSDQTDLQAVLDAKFDIPTGTVSQYLRGDGTLATYVQTPITVENSSSLFSTGLTGTGSGSNATNSIFFGANAGLNATTVTGSSFIGQSSGVQATSITQSNFIGPAAGFQSTNITTSNFIGESAGSTTSGASYSNFIGGSAGLAATSATVSNFIGYFAGHNAANAANSIFIGTESGGLLADASVDNTAVYDDFSSFAKTSILIGHRTSTGGFSNSIALGAYATNTAANQLVIGSATRKITSVRIGGGQGTGSTTNTFFVGDSAGFNASSASFSNFIGISAGSSATSASLSNFIGYDAGNAASSATESNFIGNATGKTATNARYSNFFGSAAGFHATAANNSNFIGYNAGREALNAAESTFIGDSAGFTAPNASNAIFVGYHAGYNDTVNNTGSTSDYSILLGQNTSTGGFNNSIAIGSAATNTASNQFMIGSTTRPINSTVFIGTGGTSCTITTGTSMSCSSDERLKTNIENLHTDTLEKLLAVKTVTYNWNANPSGDKMVGFLAQDLEQYFPQLVSTGPGGYLQVNYAGITPVLVEAIREMNVKITDINNLNTTNSWRDSLIAWLGNASNHITRIFTGEICLTDTDGSSECINKQELGQLKQLLHTSSPASDTPPNVTPDPTVSEESTIPTPEQAPTPLPEEALTTPPSEQLSTESTE